MRAFALTCTVLLISTQTLAQTEGEPETPAEEGPAAPAEGEPEAPAEGEPAAPAEAEAPAAEGEGAPTEEAGEAGESSEEGEGEGEGEEADTEEGEEAADAEEGEEEAEEEYEEEEYDDEEYDDEDDWGDEEGEEDDGWEITVRQQMFLLGPGLSLGIFSPDDANDFLEDWQEVIGGSDASYSPMVVNVVPSISMYFIPVEYVQFQIPVEIGISPKKVKKASGDKQFHFVRGTIGGLVNLHLPIKDKYSLFAGVGGMFHMMKLEDHTGTDWGFRAQLGFRWYKGVVVPEIFVAYDLNATAKAEGKPAPPDEEQTAEDEFNTRGVDLDYSGVVIGLNVLFNAT